MKKKTTAHIPSNNGHTIQKNFIRSILFFTTVICVLLVTAPLSSHAENDREITDNANPSLSTILNAMNTDKLSHIFENFTDTFEEYMTLSYEHFAVFLKNHFHEPIDEITTNNVVIPLLDSTDSTEKNMIASDDNAIHYSDLSPTDIPLNFNDDIACLDNYTDLNTVLSTIYMKLPAPAPLKLTQEEALVIIEKYALKEDRFRIFIDQKELYSEELLIGLANNPEMLGFAELYTNSISDSDYLEPTVVLTEKEIKSNCPLFLQWDPRWGYTPYGVNNMATSGCGPTALSMVIQGLTDQDDVTPYDVATFAMENNYYMEGSGTKWDLMLSGASHYGLSSYCLKTQEPLMKERLDKGSFLICSMRAGDFTALGHFIVIHGYDDTGFQINDPFCYERSQRTWTFKELSPQIKSIWTLSAK